MKKFAQYHLLQQSFRFFLQDFESASLMNADGELLAMKYETLPDLGTLGPLTQTVAKYFQLEEGDAVLINDPYSGGTLLTVMALVTVIKIDGQRFYLAARTRYQPFLTSSLKLEDEGLRVPPTPIAQAWQLNPAIMGAIGAHPLCPMGFADQLEKLLRKMQDRCERFKIWGETFPHLLQKSTLRGYLEETEERIRAKMSELQSGDTRIDLNLETGELLRVKVSLSPDKLIVDFSGSSHSKRLFLTDMATYGTCVAAFAAFLGEDIPVNAAIKSLVEVATPTGCMMNAKYPSPVFQGMTELAPVIATATLMALSEINPHRALGIHGTVPTLLNFQFGKGSQFFDSLAGGAGATSSRDGLDGFFFWARVRSVFSVEKTERSFPILIEKSEVRESSGGRGKTTGGNGILREYRFQEDAQITWVLGHRNMPKGIKGASNGMASELVVVHANGEKTQITENAGSLQVKAGDRLIAASAGGGGLGKTNSPTT